MLRRFDRGDTIIEVMFSFAVFSLVIVSAITLMNQGVAMAQRSLEITLVRQQIDSQIAMVQHARQVGSPVWNALRSDARDTISGFSSITSCPDGGSLAGTGAHFITVQTTAKQDIKLNDVSTTTYSGAITYAKVDTLLQTNSIAHSYGLWMILVKSEGFATNRAYDLHVRACWGSVGVSQPITIGTVTRIYDDK